MKKGLSRVGFIIAGALSSIGLIKPSTPAAEEVGQKGAIELSSEPDLPIPFGYKSVWFAISSEDTSAIFDAFNLTNRHISNWESGIKFSYDQDRHYNGAEKPIFISPPIGGWTLVLAGLNFSSDSPENIENLRSLLNRLSKHFGEAQYYGSYRVVEYVAWYQSIAGKITRGFSFADGTLFANEGQTTQAELEIGYFDMTGMDEGNIWDKLMEAEEEGTYFFDEEDPMKIAGYWSLNPLSIDRLEGLKPSTGLVGLYVD